MSLLSTRPYLIRAIYEWCCECGYTPMLSVTVNPEMLARDFPKENVKNGEIIFNIDHSAVRNLAIGNDIITFSARFNGVAKEMTFPTDAVNGIFAKEVNQGIAFPEVASATSSALNTNGQKAPEGFPKSGKPVTDKKGKANLRLIK